MLYWRSDMSTALTTIVLGLMMAVPVTAQSTFEVPTVKLNAMSDAELRVSRMWGCHGTDNQVDSRIPTGRCVSRGVPLRVMIAEAYGIPFMQMNQLLSGGPNWLDEFYDIEGKSEKPATVAELRVMLQSLLAERFKLTVHREKKEIAVFDLVVAKGGPKLKRVPEDRECVASVADGPCGSIMGGRGRGMTGRDITMAVLSQNLTNWAGRIVVDKTGLKGRFDVKTTPWNPDVPGPNYTPESGADPNDLPTFYTMVQDQLGLRLEPQKEPVDMLIVDRAEKPVQD